MSLESESDDPGATDDESNTIQTSLYALKDSNAFIVTDGCGDIRGEEEGLFRDDTRIISTYRLRIGDGGINLLGTSRSHDNAFLTTHLMYRPDALTGEEAVSDGTIHIERTKLLWDGRFYERLNLVNYGNTEITVPLVLSFAADFADIFEVRGIPRDQRGQMAPIETDDQHVTISYQGLDGLERTTVLSFSQAPSRLSTSDAAFSIGIGAHSHHTLYFEVASEAEAAPSRARFRGAAARARLAMRRRLHRGARLKSSGHLFNDWINRSRADLALLTTELPTGPYPYAGIPWFSTTFGRDAIISALQTLWLEPSLARGVLRYLARTQATEHSSFKDSAPGKIMHENRHGEMTQLGEVPFGEYYGGVDTTPLFIVLAASYADRTGDYGLVDELWPALTAALAWIERMLDAGDRGLLDYERGEATSLGNQGWKDSEDSVFHADGTMAEGPIALVEVQGYAFAAFQAMARFARRRRQPDAASNWQGRAKTLRRKVEQSFWINEGKFYAIALDGNDRPCRVRTSNPGHLLYAGLPSAERAGHVIDSLMSTDFDTGWGLRTVADSEVRFNPMAYHNGSVWPHDTALCAAGMARYGAHDGAMRLLSSMFEAAVNFDMQLPELFCGFSRDAGEPPIAYPVACKPQAWAAGSVAMMLQACLGIRIDGAANEIHVTKPRLPAGIDNLRIRNLAIGDQSIDLYFECLGNHVAVIPEQKHAAQIAVTVHA